MYVTFHLGLSLLMCGTTMYMEAKQSHDIAMRFVLQLMVEVKGTCGNVSNIKSVTTVSIGMVVH